MPLAPQEIRTFFVTTVTAQRRRLFQVEANALLLLRVLAENRAKSRMAIHAFVAMPDHVHLLLTPAPEVSLEKAMQFVKGGFSFQLKSRLEVWQPSFNEQRIKDAGDYARHRWYVEANPVRAGLVERPEAYAYSSALRREMVDAGPSHLVLPERAGAEAPSVGVRDSQG